jgi:hypothetical protein
LHAEARLPALLRAQASTDPEHHALLAKQGGVGLHAC